MMRGLSAAIVMFLLAGLGRAAEPLEFEREIRPLLIDRCGECHGAKVQKSSLRLDVKSAAFKGGDGGPVIVAGKSGDSELVRRITSADPDERMPPKAPLTAAQIDRLRKWIDEGANWPESDADRAAARDKRLDHWAWQPIRKISPPPTGGSEIDAFVRGKLAELQLQPSAEADRRTLLRRLSFDLHGLPPSPEAIAAFLADERPDAYERLVDQFLAAPQYGERWAQHWLDIAHYADTHGFERDQRRDHAWRYRDWVIDAFNRDLPYDQFLRDQIAGDALRPNDPAAVIATGFLAAGPWDFVGQAETPSPVLKRLARADDLDDMVTQVITATCGVTINCARCHDHKLDPISQREYYGLWAVFAGVKRGDRVVSSAAQTRFETRKKELESKLGDVRAAITKACGGIDLAKAIGVGIDPATGKEQKEKRQFLENAPVNQFAKSSLPLIDGVVIPGGGEVVISSTGVKAADVPKTSGKTWDAIRGGAVHSQFSTKLGDVDFAAGERSLLMLHANAAITFDLAAARTSVTATALRFTARLGYFGQTPNRGASVQVLVDGEVKYRRENFGRADGLEAIQVELPADARFLTLLATDGGGDISHDQIGFGDARLESPNVDAERRQAELAALGKEQERLQAELKSLPAPEQVYGVRSEMPPAVHILARGNPETPKEEATPSGLACLSHLPADLGNQAAEGERRIALAQWLTHDEHPLVRRVIVNRLWQHHFGVGLVDTPSDFGLGGSAPSHPELLDWLANALRAANGSLKDVHRRICTSATYRQSSRVSSAAAKKIDSGNRYLSRQNGRRLDAESLRDAMLVVSDSLNVVAHGPGYRDFNYQEEYAPIYKYITADRPELWRRSVYRFVVRTTPHGWLTTLDCPNPANLTPARNVTTTALQSLALLNDEFVLRQADRFAQRMEEDAAPEDRVARAFAAAFQRAPTAAERAAAEELVRRQGLAELCRRLFNANEFVYVD